MAFEWFWSVPKSGDRHRWSLHTLSFFFSTCGKVCMIWFFSTVRSSADFRGQGWRPGHAWFLHEFYLRRKVFHVFDSDNPRFLLQKRNINPWWYMICRWFANNWTAALKRFFTFWIFEWWLRVLKQNPSSRESFTVAAFEPRRRRISSRKSCTCRCGAEAVSNICFSGWWFLFATGSPG